MEGISSPKISGLSTKAVSFKAYTSAERPRIKAAYPFLSAEQINGKVKDLWKRMSPAEKQNYTKSSPKVTPVKETARKSIGKKMYASGKKYKRTSQNQSAEFLTGPTNVCDTPEFVNTHKLRDFHKAHVETYYNDFSSDNDATEDVDGGTRRKSHPADSSSSEDTPTKQPGILKNGDSEKLNQDTHVSFNSQNEEYILSQYSYHSDTDGEDSDDHSSRVLIRRTSEESKTSNTGYVNNSRDYDSDDGDDGGILIKRGEDEGNNSEDDDDDDKGILIKRNDTDGDINDDRGTLTKRDQNGIENNEPSMGDKQESSVEVNHDIMEGESVEAPFTNTVTRSKRRPTKKSYGSSSCSKSNKLRNQPEKEDDGELKNGIFKSPLQDMCSSKFYGKKKSTQAKKHLEKLKTPTQHSGILKAGSNPQVTPNVIQKAAEEENYTTPQMDDILQKLTLKEANKAPQKHRQNQTNPHEQQGKEKAAAAGRRVTRSLLCSPGNEKENNLIDSRSTNADTVQKNAKLRNVKKEATRKKSNGQCKKNGKQGRRVVRDSGIVAVPTNPSGDACQVTKLSPGNAEDMETEFTEIQIDQQHGKGVEAKRKRRKSSRYVKQSPDDRHNDMKAPCSPEKMDEAMSMSANKKRKIMKNTETGWTAAREAEGCQSEEMDSADWSQGSILDICSSPDSGDAGASPGARVYRRGIGTNPTLQKALMSLKSAAIIHSPTVSMDTASGGSSPRLLSPALSGISELSSASSSQSSKGCTSDISLISLSPLHPSNKPSKVLMGGDLCAMFDDVKPGDRKMEGPYVTKRMAVSNTRQHQEIFEDEPEFPFA